jgi:hypothetical protein
MAPTLITLAGEPPASASSGILPLMVLKLWLGVGSGTVDPLTTINMSNITIAAWFATFSMTMPAVTFDPVVFVHVMVSVGS